MDCFNNIVFFFPYKTIGGVSVLFLRLAEFIHDKYNIKCHLVDYHDGYMAKNRDKNKSFLIEYNGTKEIKLDGTTVIIFQSFAPWRAFDFPEFRGDSKVIFWNCHPYNLVPSTNILNKYICKESIFSFLLVKLVLFPFFIWSRYFVNSLTRARSLYYMDGENKRVTCKFLNISVSNSNYLPIPVFDKNRNLLPNASKKPSNKIDLLWLGRIVDFKYYPLIALIDELVQYQSKSEAPIAINFTIIGDGDFRSLLFEYCSRVKSIRFKFISELHGDALLKEVENSDICIGMGTSVLDMAANRKATIVLDYSYSKLDLVPSCRWLYECVDYSLGKSASLNVLDSESITKKIEHFKMCREKIETKCYRYVFNFHTLERTCEMLFGYMDDVQFQFADLKRLTKRL